PPGAERSELTNGGDSVSSGGDEGYIVRRGANEGRKEAAGQLACLPTGFVPLPGGALQLEVHRPQWQSPHRAVEISLTVGADEELGAGVRVLVHIREIINTTGRHSPPIQ